MKDKIALLVEETGCDEGEAELALELCGYEVDKAVKTIGRLLKNIVVFKGKFIHPEQNQFGLFLSILNTKSGDLLRSRAVLSFNPAVCAAPLDKGGWFDFEKHLYGCRLWEGSLPNESLEIERSLAIHFRSAAPAAIARLAEKSPEDVAAELSDVLKGILRTRTLNLKLRKDVLELEQFHSLRPEPGGVPKPAGRVSRAAAKEEELLVLKVELDEDPEGVPASELHIGDMVSVRITDPRDIAQYLAKLFGGHEAAGPMGLAAPVEAIESLPPASFLVRARFSIGVCGDAMVPRERRLKIVSSAMRRHESLSWWQKFFKS